MTLILATNNVHKRDELLTVLKRELGDAIQIQTLAEAGLNGLEIEETGTTLEENALIKARTVFELTSRPTVSDDTGLEVGALNGAPGVYSARYAGAAASYSDNVEKLLRAMDGVADRSARFRTVIAFIDSTGAEHTFSGEVEGMITTAPRGSAGFGYDPVFAPTIEGNGAKTFAEMTPDVKNQISHRANALRAFADYLKTLPR
jgi:XTP/dITP diphosphohydrolase